jgi:hypothetical protein
LEGLFPGGTLPGGELPGGELPGVVLPAPGAPKSGRLLPSESEEQAMRAIANPTKPSPAIDVFTMDIVREAPPSDRRK